MTRECKATGSADVRKRTVQEGYDALVPRFGAWMGRIEGEPSEQFLDQLAARLDDGARVLDLGCGDGRKARRLAERFDVLGVNISAEQLRLARAAAPHVRFMRADFADLNFPAETFDAVAAFYSITHVPRADHPRVGLELFVDESSGCASLVVRRRSCGCWPGGRREVPVPPVVDCGRL
jgi:ubiquinone/menaquinone biosynthesis C-methylase UbiE